MTHFDIFQNGLLSYGGAFILPFALCLGLARAGHARSAWWIPGGILLLTAAFVALGIMLGSEIPTGAHAAMGLVLLTAPAVLGGTAGILLGRRRA
jgi:hypothetical protein